MDMKSCLTLHRQALLGTKQRALRLFFHMIPQVGQDVDAPVFVAPMSRSQGIVNLRRYILISDPDADLSFLGVHSCKTDLPILVEAAGFG
jgi:hypothetical protein